MKIIDTHNHVDFHGFDADAVVKNMDQCGITRTWLLTWEAPEDEINPDMYVKAFHPDLKDMPFRKVYEAVSKYPDRFIAGFCPDPRRPDALDRLELACRSYRVQVCGELKLRMMYDSPDAIELYRLCGKLRLPVVLHIDYPIPVRDGHYPRRSYWYGGSIASLQRALEQVPDTVFIGHAPGFWGHISKDDKHLTEYYPQGPVVPGGEVVQLLETHENLYADLSAMSALNALSRDREFTRELFDRFQDRFLFARDCYTTDLRDFLDGLGLAPEILEKVYHRNAERLLSHYLE